ncbi:hypothetical protein SGCOL_007411 [Colletotrichum sp. CLE4]
MSEFIYIWALTQWNEPLQKLRQPVPTPSGTEVLLTFTLLKESTTRAEGSASTSKIAASSCLSLWAMKYSERGLGTFRHGGSAEYVLVPHPKYLVDLGDLDPAVACTFGCSGITTLSAVSKVLPLPTDEPVLLIGAGGLGLAAIAVLKAFGHKSIIATDVADEKLDAATAAAATKTVNISGPSATEDILAAINGPVIAVIDFVNSSITANLANGIIAKGAKWLQVGVMGGSIEFSLVANIFKGLTIFSNITGNLEHFRQVVQLAKEGKLSPVPVQTMDWNSANEILVEVS